MVVGKNEGFLYLFQHCDLKFLFICCFLSKLDYPHVFSWTVMIVSFDTKADYDVVF